MRKCEQTSFFPRSFFVIFRPFFVTFLGKTRLGVRERLEIHQKGALLLTYSCNIKPGSWLYSNEGVMATMNICLLCTNWNYDGCMSTTCRLFFQRLFP